MILKKFKKGDQVLVTGGKDKGKKGEIIRVLPSRSAVIVKGVNLYKRHLKATQSREGGVISVERPLPTAKIMVLVAGSPTRIGLKRSEGGVKRIGKKTGADL